VNTVHTIKRGYLHIKMQPVGGRFLVYGIAIISVYCSLTYANTEKNDFAYASEFDNNVDGDNNEDTEVILNPRLSNNSNLKVEEVSDGIDFPTSMAFLGPADILVLEKNEGTVKRILNGRMLDEPVLDVAVANDGERGLLGIATSEKNHFIKESNDSDITSVFLYYTELTGKNNDDNESIRNRLYRYEFDQNNGELVNPKLLLDLPATPGPRHNGGKIAIGPDDSVYLTVGDIGEHDVSDPSTIINAEDGPLPDGKAGILRVPQDVIEVDSAETAEGELTEVLQRKVADDDGNILSDKHPLNLYYAYGIRNSFGMDFDPITGKLWDAETGRNFGEEINLVEPGFNSGWMKAQGIWELDEMLRSEGIASPNDETFIANLVDFGGNGKYSSPEFTWGKMPVTTSGMAFFHSNKLGKQYENDLFVGDFVNGMIFNFDLNQDRTQLSFDERGPLKDKLADFADELKEVIFGYGFGGITDVKIGPDGYLYILTLDEGGSECKPKYPDRACIPYSSKVEGHILKVIPAVTKTVLPK
jgi:glucose/arabinose dehydrogenase